jgi:hypothetical protein
MGIPTINFHFWDVIAKYLKRKGFPITYLIDTQKIVRSIKKILRNPEKYKTDMADMLRRLESPVAPTIKCIERFL